MSNSLDPGDVRPDLVPNCLERLSADNISRETAQLVLLSYFFDPEVQR